MTSSDITFVLAGRPNGKTPDIISQIKYLYPKSPIILSSHPTPSIIKDYAPDPNKVDNFESIIDQCDAEILISTDPGEINDDNLRHINRRIIVTNEGLKRSETEFTFLIRPDTVISKDDILDIFDYVKRLARGTKHNVFDTRVLLSHLFTVNPLGPICRLFHPGDFFYFGRTTDIKKMWLNKPLLKQEELRNQEGQAKFVSEQYLWLTTINMTLPQYDCFTKELFEISTLSIINNFYLLTSSPKSGYYSSKHNFDVGMPVYWDEQYWHTLNNVYA